MRILNFNEISLCFSTKKEIRRCRLHRWVWTNRCRLHQGVWTCRFSLHRWVQIIGVANTENSIKNFFSQKLTGVGYTGDSGLTSAGYTGESGLTGVGYTDDSRLPGVACPGESLVQPSRPANALKGTIPEKSRLWVSSTGYWEENLVLKIYLTWHFLIDSPV
jgi:hypothetical protein